MHPADAANVVPLHAPIPLTGRDDDALMALAAVDHRPAFEVLARRYFARIAGYAAKYLGDSRAGEDVAQEVLLEVWQHRTRYRGSGRLALFLLTIARNRCRNRARDDCRRAAAGRALDAVTADGGEDQLDRLIEAELEHRLREAMLRVPERHREALLLRYDQGLPYADMARALGVPKVTLRSRVFNALRRLRDHLEEDSP
jgi:RNA polymerase sigma-70 factor (ECF subfamily)